jgi:hypothetical protein
MTAERELYLGRSSPVERPERSAEHRLPADHLVTHGVVVGMTGSGKTGLVLVAIEEALRAGIPVLAIDVKGDLANLLLAFDTLSHEPIVPFAPGMAKPNDTRTPEELARAIAKQRREGLAAWGIGESELAELSARSALRVITPGSSAGEPLHLLSSLETRGRRWDTDIESARSSLSATVSMVLRLLGRDSDPAKSREHVVLSLLAERRLLSGQAAELPGLMADLSTPPIETVGALGIDEYLPPEDRRELVQALNTLLASPTFAAWRAGATLDVATWMTPGDDGRAPGVIVSVAHLDDEERMVVLGIVLEEVLEWIRSLPGSAGLRALVVFDEVYGFLPPHPRHPPTKRPLVAMMKQARAFGVGVILATQNPMDLDYRALSNAGLWWIGRVSTDGDTDRLLDGMGLSRDDREEVGALVRRLRPRWFLERSIYTERALLQPRWALSLMRGPMTRAELLMALEMGARES